MAGPFGPPLVDLNHPKTRSMSELKRGLHADLTDDVDAEAEVDLDVAADEAASEPPEPTRRGPFRRKRSGRKKRRRRRLTLAVLPTLLTLGNGVCGLAAIAVATSVNLEWDNEQKLLVAGILIFAGMLFDALDGSAARMTGQESQFGAELDSLCDAITFGTAPAVIVWRMNDSGALPLKLTWAIGVLFALCVLIRLARFNVETDEDDTHEGFDGLPSPAAAGTLASFMIAMPTLASYAADEDYGQVQWLAQRLLEGCEYFIPALALSLAYLMVSRFQYPHVFQQLLRGRRAPHQIGQALFVLIGAVVLHWLALPIAFCYYAFAAPIRTWVGKLRGTTKVAESS